MFRQIIFLIIIMTIQTSNPGPPKVILFNNLENNGKLIGVDIKTSFYTKGCRKGANTTVRTFITQALDIFFHNGDKVSIIDSHKSGTTWLLDEITITTLEYPYLRKRFRPQILLTSHDPNEVDLQLKLVDGELLLICNNRIIKAND